MVASLNAGACVAIDGNDPKIKRHVERLARRLRCWIGRPVCSNEPLSLVRSPVGPAKSEGGRRLLPAARAFTRERALVPRGYGTTPFYACLQPSI